MNNSHKHKDKKKEKFYDSDSEHGGKFKKKFKKDKHKDKGDKKDGKLKYYIDEKGRKRYDFSGMNLGELKNEASKTNTLGLNEEKKTLIFPPADERTFLKPRDESELVDVKQIKGMVLPIAKVDNTLNTKNKKVLDEKIAALGVLQVTEDKEAHKGDVFYCKTCQCALKDNAAYTEHLNGKKRKVYLLCYLFIYIPY